MDEGDRRWRTGPARPGGWQSIASAATTLSIAYLEGELSAYPLPAQGSNPVGPVPLADGKFGLRVTVENTGFELYADENVPLTAPPSLEQLEIIAELDPAGLRNKQLKDNPPGDRR